MKVYPPAFLLGWQQKVFYEPEQAERHVYIPVTHRAMAPPVADIGIIEVPDRTVLAERDKYLFHILEGQATLLTDVTPELQPGTKG